MESAVLEERGDTLIALAMMLDHRSTADRRDGRPLSDLVRSSLDGIDTRRVARLIEKAAEVDGWSELERKAWLGRQIDNILRRGHSTKLGTNIHPDQIARVLKREPLSICRSILSYLPLDVAGEVRFLIAPDQADHSLDQSTEPPPEVIELVKRHFLSNFVQVESLHDENGIDRVPLAGFGEFIHHLGLREIAVACRGIKSRETLAAFFCRFAEDDAKAIAMYLSTLERVEPEWVASADDRVKRLWNRRIRIRQILHRIGLDLLAAALAQRSETAITYNAQKLAYRDSIRWRKMVRGWQKRFAEENEGAVLLERKRFAMLPIMAGRFIETGTV